MRFGGKGDVRGFIKRWSHSLRSERTDPECTGNEEGDDEEEDGAIPERLLSNEDLSGCQPSRRAGIQVVGRPGNGAVDLDFTWNESDGEDVEPECTESFSDAVRAMRRFASIAIFQLCNNCQARPGKSLFCSSQAKRRSGDDTQRAAGEAGETLEVPPLSIVMMVCGTRGDVQPFIALGVKLKVLGTLTALQDALCLDCGHKLPISCAGVRTPREAGHAQRLPQICDRL